MSDAAGNKSLPWMIGTLMAAILALGWGFAAAEYARDVEDLRPGGEGEALGTTSSTRRVARGAFIANAVAQLPNAVAVVTHVFAQSRWVMYVFGGLEAVAAAFGFYAWRLGRQFAEMDNRHTKKRSKR
jgi:hypothetical protein